eukprot:4576320-Alexandrium_andersonii.AAC.1
MNNCRLLSSITFAVFCAPLREGHVVPARHPDKRRRGAPDSLVLGPGGRQPLRRGAQGTADTCATLLSAVV